jgi:hypothetical protein
MGFTRVTATVLVWVFLRDVRDCFSGNPARNFRYKKINNFPVAILPRGAFFLFIQPILFTTRCLEIQCGTDGQIICLYIYIYTYPQNGGLGEGGYKARLEALTRRKISTIALWPTPRSTCTLMCLFRGFPQPHQTDGRIVHQFVRDPLLSDPTKFITQASRCCRRYII